MIVVSALMLPVMIVRFYMGVWQMVLIDLPLIAASFWSISAFYVIAQRELHPEELEAVSADAADADGGRCRADHHQHARRAGSLFGVQTAFARTPKYAIGERPVNLEVKKYRRRSGWLPYAEIWSVLFPGHDRFRRQVRRITSSHTLPGAIRIRLLLGGLLHAHSGIPGPPALAQAAETGHGAGVGSYQLSAVRFQPARPSRLSVGPELD